MNYRSPLEMKFRAVVLIVALVVSVLSIFAVLSPQQSEAAEIESVPCEWTGCGLYISTGTCWQPWKQVQVGGCPVGLNAWSSTSYSWVHCTQGKHMEFINGQEVRCQIYAPLPKSPACSQTCG